MSVAIVFPGQGSQSVGMLADLSEHFPITRQVFDEASDLLGYDLWELTQNGPAGELDKTEKTQPALLAAGYACWRAWQTAGGEAPALVAGHSLGEYSALVASDSLSLEDGFLLIRERARLMQQASTVEKGGMAAILGSDEDAVNQLCADADVDIDRPLQEARELLMRALRAQAPVSGSLTLMKLRRAVTRDDIEALLDEVEQRLRKPHRMIIAAQTMRHVRHLLGLPGPDQR